MPHARKLVAISFLAIAVAAFSGAARAGEIPKHGGSLEVGTVYATLSPLTWSPYDWQWKINHDTGMVYDLLLAADLSKAKRNGGSHGFTADAWLPSDAIRGDLAESYEVRDNPLSVVFKLRKGVMFPEKPGVMKSRELTSEDVLFSYHHRDKSPKKVSEYFDHIERVEAPDRYTVIFHFKEFNAEWDYRFAWGYHSSIFPKEVMNAGGNDWKNVNGTGPFMVADYLPGNSQTYVKNPIHWGKEKFGENEFKLPFIDRLTYRILKDEATQVTALRTGKLDILEVVRWQNADMLKKSVPQLQWNRWLSSSGTGIALRTDTKPFDDIRVRRALNMAVNKKEIIEAYYDGNAEILAYPQHMDFKGYYEPLSAMPDSIKELFTYDPAKAKKLLAEAGYPNGFTFKVQVCGCSNEHADLLPLVAGYLDKIGVKIDIKTMEYGAFYSAMVNRTSEAGTMTDVGHTNPTTVLRKSFVSGQRWNMAQYSDPAFDKKMDEVFLERDEEKRKGMVRELSRKILDDAPHIWLPIRYNYTAWWPWVKNYGGELRAGATRPGPIYARLWIDQELKKKMGFGP
jgi:peptide/nickel transport system substrate-binding protein